MQVVFLKTEEAVIINGPGTDRLLIKQENLPALINCLEKFLLEQDKPINQLKTLFNYGKIKN